MGEIQSVVLDLPWPPSVNHYWRHARGRTYIDRPGLDYRSVVRLLAISACGAFGESDRLAVLIVAAQADRRVRDLDNALKCILDSIEHAGVYPDDGQIDDLRIVRVHLGERGSVEPGRVQVTITRIGGA